MSEQTQEAAVPEWTLGWRLQRALAHAGLTIDQMAQEIGVSRSTASRWINDHGAEPRIGYLKLWALRTGVPLSWLMGEGLIRQARSSPDRPAGMAAAA
jgi:transcriptional regulator with XRE-family HTH domain